MRQRAVYIVTIQRPCRSVLNGETKERTTKKQACFVDVAPPNRHPPSQSARIHANQLAAPHRPCPGGDVSRTSGSARTQTEATEKLREASRGGARSCSPHHRLWNKHAFRRRLSAQQESPGGHGPGRLLSTVKPRRLDVVVVVVAPCIVSRTPPSTPSPPRRSSAALIYLH